MTKQLKIYAAIGLITLLTATPLLAGEPLNEPIKPIPATVDVDPTLVALGRKLFHDTRLSKDDSISCASCHDLANGGVDHVKVSTGIGGKQGDINSPTVYNTGLLFRLFWDGRAETLEAQVDGPIQHPSEMGSLWPEVVAKLYEDAEYPGLFDNAFGGGINRQNIKSAIAEFERSLITPNSRFDQYLLGNADAITDFEKTGYQNFKKYGCISCHQGAAVGGNMFQLFGVANSYFQTRGNITKADMGRFNVTGNVLDKHSFKVPSLRLAALTPPYLHDGNAATLRDAVDIMFKFQLGREAPDEDKDAIVAFIKTLVGEHPEMKK
ncbi:MAG: cytochrome B6 [Gammaproteobacteria bacterium]|nr:cytochrome B6 [Gammaproteobacteria bacterium]